MMDKKIDSQEQKPDKAGDEKRPSRKYIKYALRIFGIKHDPVEFTVRYWFIMLKYGINSLAVKMTTEEWGTTGLGFYRVIWSYKQELLKEHGITWYAPTEMNPDIMFD